MSNVFTPRSWRVLLAGLSLLLAGCGKGPVEGPTLVEGQVVEHASRQPVGGATVQVWQAGRGGGYAPVGQGQPTDAGGRFSFRFEADTKTGYLLLATAPPGYVTDWGLAPDLTAGRKNQGLFVPMYAPAWVRLLLVDEPPKSRVSMYISGYEGNGDRVNYPSDTAFVRPCVAGLTKGIYWSITDERGITTSYSQNVQMTALDSVTVRIPF